MPTKTVTKKLGKKIVKKKAIAKPKKVEKPKKKQGTKVAPKKVGAKKI